MDIGPVPFTVTDWSALAAEEHPGDSGASFWRTFAAGNIRVRRVDYSPGFRSDHYCPRGHVLLVLQGELVVALKDGREFVLTAGMGFEAGDDHANPHLAYSTNGATVFIVD